MNLLLYDLFRMTAENLRRISGINENALPNMLGHIAQSGNSPRDNWTVQGQSTKSTLVISCYVSPRTKRTLFVTEQFSRKKIKELSDQHIHFHFTLNKQEILKFHCKASRSYLCHFSLNFAPLKDRTLGNLVSISTFCNTFVKSLRSCEKECCCCRSVYLNVHKTKLIID